MKTPLAHPYRAFTLVEFLIVTGVLAFLAVLLLSSIAHNRNDASRISCANNLKQMGLSFRTWALDNSDLYPMHVSLTNGGTMELITQGKVFPIFMVMSNELSTPRILLCADEMDRARRPASSFTPAAQAIPSAVPLSDNCLSYFVNADASENDSTAVISGDHTLSISNILFKPGLQFVSTTQTLTWHKQTHPKTSKSAGNILLSDGSVQQMSVPPMSSNATNLAQVRLLIP